MLDSSYYSTTIEGLCDDILSEMCDSSDGILELDLNESFLLSLLSPVKLNPLALY